MKGVRGGIILERVVFGVIMDSSHGTPSALSRLDFRVDELQFASSVFDFHLPINASLPRVNIS